MQDYYFSCVANIGLVDKAAVARPDLYRFNIAVTGQYPLQYTGRIFVLVVKIAVAPGN